MGDIFDKFENGVTFEIHDKYFIVHWAVKGRGFGDYTFYKDGDKLICDNECDSRQSIKDVLCMLVDSLELIDKG
jgi:hypothetical protein